MRKVLGALAGLGALTALLVVSSGAGASTTPRSYIIAAKNSLPANIAAQVEAAGGTLTDTIPEVGIAVASSTEADFSAKASKIGTVSPNIRIQLVDPDARMVAGPGVDFANPPTSGDDDFYFDLQWGHDAIDAVEAWNAGYRGAGARVAVLDTGFDLDHPDLAPNINMALSKDFTGEGLSYSLPDPFSHGSHTAGTVAAADNGFGTIGVAPEAELVLVKMLSDEGSGTFADGIDAIVYAAGDADADVISMSWGAVVPKTGDPSDPELDTPEEVDALKHALNRATSFAYRHGATLIASAGNDGEDYDVIGGDVVNIPAESLHVLAISALAPVGWAVDPTTSLDNQASYTNYGRSLIEYGAPGGDFVYPGNENCTVVITRPCWVFDLVFSTGSSLDPSTAAYFWSAGTSMAAPHVAGTAAVIVGKNGGDMNPAQVNKAILAGSDDLGPGGKDPTYGRGRVNVGNSVAP